MLSLQATLLATMLCMHPRTASRKTIGSLMCSTPSSHAIRGLLRSSSDTKTCCIVCSRPSLLLNAWPLQWRRLCQPLYMGAMCAKRLQLYCIGFGMLQMLSLIRHERPPMFFCLPVPAFSVEQIALLWHAGCQHAELLAAYYPLGFSPQLHTLHQQPAQLGLPAWIVYADRYVAAQISYH